MDDAIANLLSEIQEAALDEAQPVTVALRHCVALGGVSESELLRDWASKELKGYAPDDVLPHTELCMHEFISTVLHPPRVLLLR